MKIAKAIGRLGVIGWLLVSQFIAGSVLAEDDGPVISVGVSYSSKPYVFDNDRGIIPDVIRSALALSGYQVNFIQMSNQQAIEQFHRGEIDAIALGNKHVVDGYVSVPYVDFHNMAITLENRQLDIKQLNDLSGKHVVAFSQAHKYLGSSYARMVPRLAGYQEFSRQWQQVEWLMKGKADVVIADREIFKYYLRQFFNQSDEHRQYLQKIVYHPVFTANSYGVVFNTASLRDAFNQGLKHLKSTGQLELLKQFNRSLVTSF